MDLNVVDVWEEVEQILESYCRELSSKSSDVWHYELPSTAPINIPVRSRDVYQSSAEDELRCAALRRLKSSLELNLGSSNLFAHELHDTVGSHNVWKSAFSAYAIEIETESLWNGDFVELRACLVQSNLVAAFSDENLKHFDWQFRPIRPIFTGFFSLLSFLLFRLNVGFNCLLLLVAHFHIGWFLFWLTLEILILVIDRCCLVFGCFSFFSWLLFLILPRLFSR